MKISELQPKQPVDEMTCTVVEKGEARPVKSGMLQVCDCTVKDDSGTVTLTLWNNDIEAVNQGDVVKITKGWVNEFQGKMSVSSGRFGKLEVVGKSDEAALDEKVPEDVKEAIDNEVI